MKFSAAVLAFAAGAMANKNITYVTEVVSAYTTYCPAATVITHGDKTYTVTSVRSRFWRMGRASTGVSLETQG